MENYDEKDLLTLIDMGVKNGGQGFEEGCCVSEGVTFYHGGT